MHEQRLVSLCSSRWDVKQVGMLEWPNIQRTEMELEDFFLYKPRNLNNLSARKLCFGILVTLG